MVNWVKILFLFLASLLLGVLGYLGWLYFANQQLTTKSYTQENLDPTPSPTTYMVVDENPITERFEGLIFCLKDVPKNSPLTTCEDFGLVLDDETSYRLVESQIDASIFLEKERVFVMGIRAPGPSSSGAPDGTIYGYEISKI